MDGYTSARKAYTESSILTAPPERLVVMLYDGAIRFLTQALHAQRAGNPARCREGLRRAEAIISELNHTLDMSQGEVAERLRAIYLFCKRHLMEAQLHSDPERIERVIALLSDLRASWEELARTGREAAA